MGKIGECKLDDIDMMDVIVMEDGEFTFHVAEFDSRPPFVFRVPKYAHSASSHALRDGVIAFKRIRCAENIEIARWLDRNGYTTSNLSVRRVRVPNNR